MSTMTPERSVTATGDQARPLPGPVGGGERLGLLDLLRGIALFGILLVNIEYFASSVYEGYNRPEFGGLPNDVARWFVLAFAQGKYYLLFSLLFGYGLATQLARAGAGEGGFVRRYLRRLGGLFLFGLVHAILLFVGDILVAYALLGAGLIPLRGASTRRLLTWSIGLLVGGVLLLAALGALLVTTGANDGGPDPEVVRRIYADGSFAAIVRQRLEDLGWVYLVLPFVQAPSAFAMFLLGMVCGQRGLLADPAGHGALFRAIARRALPIGLLGRIVGASLGMTDPEVRGWAGVLALLIETATALALTLGYLAVVALLTGRARWRRRLAPIEALGRMSLSNYLVQSLVCSTIFNGYGLGLFGRVGPVAGLALAAAIWLALIPISRGWMGRFRFGPAEWLLRSVTYGRWQALRPPPLGRP